MGLPGGRLAKRVALEGLGWLLVLAGIAAIVLPGPGLIAIFAGLVLLSQQYDWAARRVEPVRLRAMKGAADSVESWPSMVGAVLVALWLIGFGVLWIVRPAAPSWWPLRESWWLLGGLWTGVTLIGSGLFVVGMLIYSYRRFRGKPEARAALDDHISLADAASD